MDSMSYRNNRSTTPQRTNAESAAPSVEIKQAEVPPAPRGHRKEVPKKSRKPLTIVLAIVVVAVIALSAWWFIMRPGSVDSTIDNGKFQAVFFTNGQVYFGKLGVVNGEYMRLTDIYYLQTKADTKDDKNPQETATESNDVELIKLGSEIHGPDDEMIISKDQVLFFENLKEDSTVSKTIAQYQEQQK